MLNKYLLLNVAVVLIVGLTASTPALAADGAALYKAKLCNTCHGPEGKAPIMPLYPKVNGQPKAYLFNQMKDIKTGKRDNGLSAAMKATVANVSDADLEAIAEYLSKVE